MIGSLTSKAAQVYAVWQTNISGFNLFVMPD